MISSLSSVVTPSGYHCKSSALLVNRSARSARRGEAPSWHVHAAAREEGSDTVSTPISESPKSKETDGELSSRRSAGNPGRGFGPRPPPPPPKPPKPSLASKEKQSITSRRPSPSRPVGLPTSDPAVREQDNVFIVGLTVLGALIFLEGIAVAGSGLLPENLDAFVVKYVYPAFTPTVGLFLAGAVLYGVFKIRQGDPENTDKLN
ncbi:hypothetical protein GOP47_0004594 [Adiantum capillus-veneris]|uniref:Uncharacterized protein n=1 Tax=Adiantum capillus-veneris TaxID=13818 RepID=A0A9D4ZMH9_ADICA|nr:hypothetical protein GOP47_0004057 [Adiantum capillus-veneris]KAI5081411.1 hypothetical protein GOP47_0004594 [Adiantum capillus-veneris]